MNKALRFASLLVGSVFIGLTIVGCNKSDEADASKPADTGSMKASGGANDMGNKKNTDITPK
ncbi:MAG: hypothetical protein ABJA67_17200 [Chthonomonadales bacterium]